MNRIASPALGSLAAKHDVLAGKHAQPHVGKPFAALRAVVAANRVDVLHVAGTTASASLADISLAVAIAVAAKVFKRLDGTSRTSFP
ncbi:hypothetical protein DN523_20590 [Burkholderia multivorans]|uniref:hypothetical protein n=1 Tax=Burkholderia multivorans TaxID=87883 RepID=UPI000DAB553A|nr:hypothetical protein [Burkholderia multivorans]MBR7896590.1 hypothetical protein [Burkholderia multivorans]RAA28833.1 hypothetical protein DN471_09560 [Burkholderia multivorans]RAA31686.1 hypothetical protein DN470_02095 [Burkholderia multivorans]RAA38253.1 hypothetical protein DN465_03195 [Burkholderia multivorans]RAA44419.1 hypothetical protein DN500_15195 [Burkholderia multivorans]